MSVFDSILGQVTGNLDVGSLAGKVGLAPAQTEQAVAALAAGHQSKGDTVDTAAAKTGMDPAKLQEVLRSIGGEGALSGVASMLAAHPEALSRVAGFLDRDGDGNPLDDIAGMAGGLFRR